MNDSRDILLISYGFVSEELRMLSLAEQLKAKGHRVTYCGSSYWEKVCVAAGLGFFERVYPRFHSDLFIRNFTVDNLVENMVWPQKSAMVDSIADHLDGSAYDIVGFEWPLSGIVHVVGIANAKPVQIINAPWFIESPLADIAEDAAFHAYPSILHKEGHGFPFSNPQSPPEIAQTFLSQHPRPICFTLGNSAILNSSSAMSFFRVAALACERLKRPAIFVNAENLATPSRTSLVLGAQTDPRRIFLQCSAVVHHGGICTTSQALWSGRPQVIVPYGLDQPDNGKRVAEAMAGVLVETKDFGVENLITAIGQAEGLSVGASIAGTAMQDKDRENSLADDFITTADNFYFKCYPAGSDEDSSGEEWKEE